MIKLLKCGEVEVSTVVQFPWTHAKPFLVNERGKLVHRVIEGADIYSHWGKGCKSPDAPGCRYSHSWVYFYCGGGTTGSLVDDGGHLDLVDKVPDGQLVCDRCEYEAKRKGHPCADTLNGRHVHRGQMVVQQTCCGGGIK